MSASTYAQKPDPLKWGQLRSHQISYRTRGLVGFTGIASKYAFDALEKESLFCARTVYGVLNQSRTDNSLYILVPCLSARIKFTNQ